MSQVTINLIVISTFYLWKDNLVKKLTGSKLYKELYSTNGNIVNVIEWIDNYDTYSIHIHSPYGVPHELCPETKGSTVVTILYDLDDKNSLQLANRYINDVKFLDPTASVLLVAVEHQNSKHLVPASCYSMTDDCTFFTEKNIRSRGTGSATGTMGNFVHLVVEQVKNQTKGNAVADIDLLMKKIAKGKHSSFGWDYYENDDPSYLTAEWFSQ